MSLVASSFTRATRRASRWFVVFVEESSTYQSRLKFLFVVCSMQADEDEVTEFQWDVITRFTRKGNRVGLMYTADDDDEERIVITSPLAEFMETVINRVFQEQSWVREKRGEEPLAVQAAFDTERANIFAD